MMGQLFQKVNGQLVEVPLAEKNDNVPILMVSDVHTVPSDQLANVWLYELGDNIYSLNFDIPVGASAAVIENVTIEALPAGSIPTVTQEPSATDPTSVVLKFGIPQGTAPADISVGTTTTLLAGQNAWVTITGDSLNPNKFTLDFGIPKGADSYSAAYYGKPKPATGSTEEATLLAAMPDGGLITFKVV